jgi:hypothetical protein
MRSVNGKKKKKMAFLVGLAAAVVITLAVSFYMLQFTTWWRMPHFWGNVPLFAQMSGIPDHDDGSCEMTQLDVQRMQDQKHIKMTVHYVKPARDVYMRGVFVQQPAESPAPASYATGVVDGSLKVNPESNTIELIVDASTINAYSNEKPVFCGFAWNSPVNIGEGPIFQTG